MPMLYRMIDSPAYKRLTNASRTAYLLLRRQVKKPGDREVIFPYKDAELYMNRHTFSGAIKQLQELGFIEKSGHGGLYRQPNVYRFVEKWRDLD